VWESFGFAQDKIRLLPALNKGQSEKSDWAFPFLPGERNADERSRAMATLDWSQCSAVEEDGEGAAGGRGRREALVPSFANGPFEYFFTKLLLGCGHLSWHKSSKEWVYLN
jgi:hypothetical protein